MSGSSTGDFAKAVIGSVILIVVGAWAWGGDDRQPAPVAPAPPPAVCERVQTPHLSAEVGSC